MGFQIMACQGDTKSSAKGGDASAKKDVQPSPNAQVDYIFMNYTFVAGRLFIFVAVSSYAGILYEIDSLLIKVLFHKVLITQVLR